MDLSSYWKTIVDTLQDGVMVIDPFGTIVAVNPAVSQITGYLPNELIGRSCRILDCTGCKIFGKGPGKKWCGLYKEGDVRAKQCSITDKDQRIVAIIKNASVLRDENNRIIGAVETLKDMSQVIRQQEEILALRRSLHLDTGYHGIVGRSSVMQDLYELIESVALTEAPVLIAGESGTGKELVARAIHEASSRSGKPFVKVNCAALNENLLESELFGHAKGSFTGAQRTRIGRFEAAHGGTIFLDEIGDIPLSTQVKLLRVLEERVIERVGEHAAIKVDVRIISATHRDLEGLVRDGVFRSDLFFRINVFPLICPALKDRAEDIPAIVLHFIHENVEKSGKQIIGVTPPAMEKLVHFPWPGNVRELRNTIEYAFVLCAGGVIDTIHLPTRILEATPGMQTSLVPLNGADQAEKEKLIAILNQVGSNQSEAARILGVSRITVWKRIKRLGIDLKKEVRG